MSEGPWYYCLTHNAVESADDACPAIDRLGPYNTPAEAANALEKVRERNEEWDAEDEADEDDHAEAR